MSGDLLNDVLSDLNIKDTEELRNKLTNDIKAMRKLGNLSLTVFVPAKLREKFETAKVWAHENTINMIVEEIERERNAPPEDPEDLETPQEPNIA
jgi:threonine dehydrogenase-like Zn-dependent dehydrogenase